jgi:hypothetical protein
MERTVVEANVPNTCLLDLLAGDESEGGSSAKVEYLVR